MSKLLFFIGLTFSSLLAFGQFNDTVFYNSGKFTIAEVISFDDKKVEFYTLNEKGDTLKNSDGTFILERFVCYDANNILQYDSKNIPEQIAQTKLDKKYPDSLDISRHEVSFNPIMPVLLSFSGFHKLNFGKKRQFSLISRLSYLNSKSDIFYTSNFFTLGTGCLWTPYRNERFSFGFDYSLFLNFEFFESQGFSSDLVVTLPATINVDFYINRWLGLRFDVGFFEDLGDGYQEFHFRGYVGFLFLFPNKKRVATNY